MSLGARSPSATVAPKREMRVYHAGSTRKYSPVTEGEDYEAMEALPSVSLLCTKEYATVYKLDKEDRLTEDNWFKWKEAMRLVFTSCDVTDYVDGIIERPHRDDDPEGAA